MRTGVRKGLGGNILGGMSGLVTYAIVDKLWWGSGLKGFPRWRLNYSTKSLIKTGTCLDKNWSRFWRIPHVAKNNWNVGIKKLATPASLGGWDTYAALGISGDAPRSRTTCLNKKTGGFPARFGHVAKKAGVPS